jgi:hypothetical protein
LTTSPVRGNSPDNCEPVGSITGCTGSRGGGGGGGITPPPPPGMIDSQGSVVIRRRSPGTGRTRPGWNPPPARHRC